MFTVDYKQDVNSLELKNPDHSNYAKIDLNLGGSLQELKLGNQEIISAKDMPPYHAAFMSSILFPFANRIENGQYAFNNKNFTLEKNEVDRQNALHGLVHDKIFRIVTKEVSDGSAAVEISYDEIQTVPGFPFKYSINLCYTLTENSMELKVKARNKDNDEFPFVLGWHPYFRTKDLYNSQLKLHSRKRLLVNENMIPNGETAMDWNGFRKIEDKAFDDCFVLNNNEVEFKTPEYHLRIICSTEENYLQLYTPDNRKCIAIEPQTAPANSFNSKMGLQVLKPNETYNASWKINLK